jgi:uncharacterized protein DUF1707
MSEDAMPQVQSSELAAHDSIRASHEDRDKVVEHLRMAGGDGRLDSDELGERVGAALAARTYGELAALVADLPAAPGSPIAAVAGKPKDVIRIDCGSGHTRREGNWSVPRRMDIRVRSGGVNVRAPWDGAGVPVTLRIVVNGSVSSGRIKARPPHRSFWGWLSRGPRPYALPSPR